MAKYTLIIIAALCCITLFGSAYCAEERFCIEGKVYCDTCRAQFLTRASEYMAGATVRFECKEENGTLSFSKEAVTDASGSYKVEVDGDHADEICEVKLVKSSRDDCTEVDSSSHLEQAAFVSITNNNGIVSPVRHANPLGFLKKDPLPICAEILSELDINVDDGTFFQA